MGLKRSLPESKVERTLLALGSLIIIVLGALITYHLLNPSYFPSSVKKGNKFSLYYPVNPPSGLSVDKTSFKSPQSQVITYAVDASGSPKFFVSLEPVPDSFDPAVFEKNFIEVFAFHTTVGSALIGTLNTQLIGEVRTSDNTLILINTSDINSSVQLKSLLSSFQKTN